MSLYLQGGSPGLETTNTNLAAALCAVGIPLRKKTPVRVVAGPKGDRYTFFFEASSPCGIYKTHELMRAWDDAAWHDKNPEHPFAYLKVACDNEKRLLDYIKRRVPIAAVVKGSKIAFLSLHAPDAVQRAVFRELGR
jgi:hypothetical protein